MTLLISISLPVFVYGENSAQVDSAKREEDQMRTLCTNDKQQSSYPVPQCRPPGLPPSPRPYWPPPALNHLHQAQATNHSQPPNAILAAIFGFSHPGLLPSPPSVTRINAVGQLQVQGWAGRLAEQTPGFLLARLRRNLQLADQRRNGREGGGKEEGQHLCWGGDLSSLTTLSFEFLWAFVKIVEGG